MMYLLYDVNPMKIVQVFLKCVLDIALILHTFVVLNHKGGTALIDASYNGNVEVVKLLLALPGIDYNHENNKVRDRVVTFLWCMLC
jgi:ankyrin repeat protein